MTITKALKAGWAVKIWPHYRGYTVVFMKGDRERVGRAGTVKRAVKIAWR